MNYCVLILYITIKSRKISEWPEVFISIEMLLCRAHHDELHRDVRAFEGKYGSQIVLLFRFLDYAIAVGVIGSVKN